MLNFLSAILLTLSAVAVGLLVSDRNYFAATIIFLLIAQTIHLQNNNK